MRAKTFAVHAATALGAATFTLAGQYAYEHLEPAILRFQLASACMTKERVAADSTPLQNWMTLVRTTDADLEPLPPPAPVAGR